MNNISIIRFTCLFTLVILLLMNTNCLASSSADNAKQTAALSISESVKGPIVTTDVVPVIDIHVHIAGLGYGESGCFINEKMRNNIRFPIYLWAMGISESELEREGDAVLFGKISQSIADSQAVQFAVILALDGYVNDEGELNRELTQIYVPNDYVAKQTKKYDNLLFGASINPNRKDAVTQLQWAYDNGAVLIKWLPSIMNIDPSSQRYIPFYQKLADLGLPLLTHTGREKSFSNANDALADPLLLQLPLEQGVTVIAAHIATTGESDGEDNFVRIQTLFTRYPNLYVDISSLTQVNKLGYLAKALQKPVITGRMLYGSDWPLQFFPLVSSWYHLPHISLGEALGYSRTANQWDRDVALKRAFNVPEAVFRRANSILRFEQNGLQATSDQVAF